MGARITRVVVVTRPTPLELLIQRFGTYGQARFHLQSRGEKIDWFEELHERLEQGLRLALSALPTEVPYTRVGRDDLDRFLFSPDDGVMIVGQDGLVANVAKYLSGQLAFGINPDPEHYDGVLCPHPPQRSGELLDWSAKPDARFRLEPRVLAEAEREDGQRLLALNEIFIGHRTHQSARYRLRAADMEERQSSSGLIVATGTGSTGWARSIVTQRGIAVPMPTPVELKLAWFVREPWPSVASGAALNFGWVDANASLRVVSEMGEGGVIFADGIESDCIEFASGQSVRVGIAAQRLNLVVPA
jgi:NAD kinase